MGASSSKATRGAAGAARKYPARAPGATIPQATTKRTPQAKPHNNDSKDDGAMDPDFSSGDFSRRLHQMGIVQPNPTFSPSTASPNLSPESMVAPLGPMFPSAKHNATLTVLDARRQLQQRADQDFEAMGRGVPRRFVDMRTLVEVVELRNRGVQIADVEKRFRLEPGLLSKLGPPSLFTHLE
ncbi:hypothetical protein PT974_06390 [Cladobotryum mycophilum]|uniref:Helix-turn-helix domain-containing protein n=1 Tax=Cladobotryum mycophilum TaxID=491253 RepID=A0ABR0SLC8_9HYPO